MDYQEIPDISTNKKENNKFLKFVIYLQAAIIVIMLLGFWQDINPKLKSIDDALSNYKAMKVQVDNNTEKVDKLENRFNQHIDQVLNRK